MNECERFADRIDEYVDGALAEQDRAAIEGHLATCASCRDELKAVRALVAEARHLPKARTPPPDVWAGIDRTLDSLEGRARRRRQAFRVALLAAAAVVLVATSAAVTAVLLRPPAAPAAALASASATEAEMAAAVEDLEAAFRRVRDRMRPDARAVVERNLAVIDAAIRETRAALATVGGDPNLERLLLVSYRAKLDLLDRATRI
jgi:anti-sigma factor RsiW